MRAELTAAPAAGALARQLSALRRANEATLRSRELTGEEKLRIINDNNEQIRMLTKQFSKAME